jgi:hypothetical protein
MPVTPCSAGSGSRLRCESQANLPTRFGRRLASCTHNMIESNVVRTVNRNRFRPALPRPLDCHLRRFEQKRPVTLPSAPHSILTVC